MKGSLEFRESGKRPESEFQSGIAGLAALVAGVQKQEFLKVQKYGKEFQKVRDKL